MKRGPVFVLVLGIELLIAVFLIYNYRFLLDRLSLNSSPTAPVTGGVSGAAEAALTANTDAPLPTQSTNEREVVLPNRLGAVGVGQSSTQGTLIPNHRRRF
ncbi:MAG: hypothetical protein R2867_43480 [Caldilineaceae bacterium]